MKIKPFEDAGGFTTFHNTILDHIMPLCSANEWKILCVTIRKTVGWQKADDWISLSLYKRLSGIKSRTTVIKAIQSLLGLGFLKRTPYRDSFKYALNREYSVEIGLPSTKNVPPISTKSEHTKDNTTKDKPTKEKKNTYTNDLKKQFVYVLADIMEMDANLNFGKLAKWGKALHRNGYTPKQLSEIYGYGGVYWKEDWRGKDKKQTPNYATITDSIKKLSGASKHKEEDHWKKYVEGEFSDFIEH